MNKNVFPLETVKMDLFLVPEILSSWISAVLAHSASFNNTQNLCVIEIGA